MGSGECRIRTCEGKIHQIYSLTPLTARETPLVLAPERAGTAMDAWVVCLCCVPVVAVPAGSDGWLDVTSGWQVGNVEMGYCRTVVLDRRGYCVRAEFGPAPAAGRVC